MTHPANRSGDKDPTFDAIIVGAGFAGLYMLHRLRGMGLTARVYEAGGDVGGTWYWNRYPGARCDVESLAYSYSFSEELQREWEWTDRYPTQPEILRYIRHVADRFDLRRDIRFERRVESVHFDEAECLWQVRTDQGDHARAPFCIMATGCLSVPLEPDLPGLRDFAGGIYRTNLWPHEAVHFGGRRVGIFGTGSTGIQSIPVIADEAAQLTVFQRTANFSIPAMNAPLDPEFVREFKARYPEHRAHQRLGLSMGSGDLEVVVRDRKPALSTAESAPQEEVDRVCKAYWSRGGAHFMTSIGDLMSNEASNRRVADFVRARIRAIVNDPATAEALCPTTHPIGTKRICVDTNYYDTYNRSNVRLIDLRKHPVEAIEPGGVRLADRFVELDDLVLATGFDAMTGALLRMDIRGLGGRRLEQAWREGPRTYLGLMVPDFPNLFTVTGPGSPSVLSNMVVSIEQHVNFIADILGHMREQGYRSIRAKPEAEAAWTAEVNRLANATLYPKGGSWYLGANVEGKPRVFMPYVGGVGAYRKACEAVAAENYRGFDFQRSAPALAMS